MYNNEFFQSNNMESSINGNQNYVNQDMDIDVNMTNYAAPGMNSGSSCGEGVQERVINRTFVHEVPQDCFFMIDKNREV